MFPETLKILLGQSKSRTPRSEIEKSETQNLNDWLDFNDLDHATAKDIIDQVLSKFDIKGSQQPKTKSIDLSANDAFKICTKALRLRLPKLIKEIELISQEAPRCLSPLVAKHPLAFTFDLGYQNLPFISLHFRNRDCDLLAMAHEFGHALQIVASWDSGHDQMPTLARECCAFLSEIILLEHLKTDFPSLLDAYHSDNMLYFGAYTHEIAKALNDPSLLYKYVWNYPIARYAAQSIAINCTAEGVQQIFSAGPSGGAFLTATLQEQQNAQVHPHDLWRL